MVDVVDEDEVVVDVAVVVVGPFWVVLVVLDEAGGLVVVVGRPGGRKPPGIDVLVEVVVEEVLDVLDVELVGAGTPVLGERVFRSSWSGEAVNRSLTGRPAWPALISSPKIWAGKDPPVTARPCTFDIGFAGVFGSPSSYPIQTPVTSCGVKPINHASKKFSDVPVLPAAGRSPRDALPAMPWVMLPTMISVAL